MILHVHPVEDSVSLIGLVGSAATSAALASLRLLINFLFHPGLSLASNTPESCILPLDASADIGFGLTLYQSNPISITPTEYPHVSN